MLGFLGMIGRHPVVILAEDIESATDKIKTEANGKHWEFNAFTSIKVIK